MTTARFQRRVEPESLAACASTRGAARATRSVSGSAFSLNGSGLPPRYPVRREHPILTLKQLPESRRAIVAALKEHGSATIAELAPRLALTGEAVRQQLLQLQREGWIEAASDAASVRGRTGRPATRYRLTDAGEHLFPKHYDTLAVAIIDALAEEVGVDAAARVLARVTSDRVTAIAPTLDGLTLEARLEILRGWYSDDDPYMTFERDGADYRLVERNCPYYNTAMSRPALCSVSVNALTQLLGVRVHREEKFQDGDGRCVFRVHANEPVDARPWPFELES